MVKLRQSGYLLLEALITIALLTGLTGVLLPFIKSMEASFSKRQQMLNLMTLNLSLDDQFEAQFQRLGSVGCHDAGQWLEVGSSQSKPARLTRDDLDPSSDWLYGVDSGLCAAYGWSDEQEVDVSLVCDNLKVGDTLYVSSCGQNTSAKVLSTQNGRVKAWKSGVALTGEVLVYSATDFYWFVKMGKSGHSAFWRRPSASGNALELMTGLEHVRFYPVLDRDFDGSADEIFVDHGVVPTSQLKAILIEYLYRLGECDLALTPQSYQTLRGDQWLYDGICSKVGKRLVSIGQTL